MGSVFVYGIAAGFGVGITLASLKPWSLPDILAVALVSCALVAWAALHRRAAFAPVVQWMGIVLFVCAFGILRMEYAKWQLIHPWFEQHIQEEVAFVGTVVREPDVRDSRTQLTVDVDGVRVLVSIDRFIPVSYGDRVYFEGTLMYPEPFETDLGRSFDYPGYLASRGIRYVVSFATLEVREHGHGNPLLARLIAYKHVFMRTLEAYLTEPQVGLGEGVLLGVKRALGEALEEAFRRAGIIHIVVLSGYNIMLVATFFTHILLRRARPLVRTFVGIGAIIAFALMVGPSASVVRASIMASLFLFVPSTGHTYSAIRGLLLAGVVMLFFNPYALVFDIGFQLSFLATLGLIVVSPYLDRHFTHVTSWFGIKSFLIATLATQLFVTPLLLYHMGQFSVVALLVNVLVLPAVPFAMLGTALTGVLGLVSHSLGVLAGVGTHLVLSYILVIVTWCASLSFAVVTVPAFPFWVTMCMYGILGFLWYWLSSVRTTDSENVLNGWVIEDEQMPEGERSSPSGTLPIFFR